MLTKYYLILERKLFQWVLKRRVAIGLYIVTLLFIPLMYIIPYLNLYINTQVITFLILSSAVIVFRIRIEILSIILIGIFIVCIPLVLIRSYDRAEVLINLVYGLLFVGFISNFWRLKD